MMERMNMEKHTLPTTMVPQTSGHQPAYMSHHVTMSPHTTMSTQTASDVSMVTGDKMSDMHRHTPHPDQPTPSSFPCSPLPSCSECGKVFKNSSQLSQHKLVHSNHRKYKCTHCDKAFKQLSHLQQHTRMHTGEKPYKCKEGGCERAFAQMANLQHHMRMHRKNYNTQGVGNVSSSDNLNWLKCDECDQQFLTSRGVNCHKQKVHTKYDPAVQNPIKPEKKPRQKSGKSKVRVKAEKKDFYSDKNHTSCDYFAEQHNAVSSSTPANDYQNGESIIKKGIMAPPPALYKVRNDGSAYPGMLAPFHEIVAMQNLHMAASKMETSKDLPNIPASDVFSALQHT